MTAHSNCQEQTTPLPAAALRGGRSRQGVVDAVSKSAARTIGSELGRQIIRGVLGSILGGNRR